MDKIKVVTMLDRHDDGEYHVYFKDVEKFKKWLLKWDTQYLNSDDEDYKDRVEQYKEDIYGCDWSLVEGDDKKWNLLCKELNEKRESDDRDVVLIGDLTLVDDMEE